MDDFKSRSGNINIMKEDNALVGHERGPCVKIVRDRFIRVIPIDMKDIDLP
jgi:hypothetical protein